MCHNKKDGRFAVKNAVLPIGFIVVDGPQGVGKTSFVTAKLKEDFRKAGAARRVFAENRIRELKSTGNYSRLSCPNHLYWSSVDIMLHRGINCWWIDTHVLGLPNPFFAVQYFPKGSVAYISEADVKLWCRDWANLNPYLKLLLKYVRHNYMTVIFDLQVNGELDKALRGLQTERYDIFDSYQRKGIFRRTYSVWRYDWSRPQLITLRKDHEQSGRRFGRGKVREMSKTGRYKFKGNIFKSYNSFTGEAYFLDGLEEYLTINHPDVDITPEGIKRYCEMFPLVRPEEMTKENMTYLQKLQKKEVREKKKKADLK